jgi:hypothetical protein
MQTQAVKLQQQQQQQQQSMLVLLAAAAALCGSRNYVDYYSSMSMLV